MTIMAGLTEGYQCNDKHKIFILQAWTLFAPNLHTNKHSQSRHIGHMSEKSTYISSGHSTMNIRISYSYFQIDRPESIFFNSLLLFSCGAVQTKGSHLLQYFFRGRYPRMALDCATSYAAHLTLCLTSIWAHCWYDYLLIITSSLWYVNIVSVILDHANMSSLAALVLACSTQG